MGNLDDVCKDIAAKFVSVVDFAALKYFLRVKS